MKKGAFPTADFPSRPPAYAIPRSYPSDSSDGDDTPGQQSKARANGKPPVQPQLKPRSVRAGDMRASDSAGSDGSDTESTGTLDSHFARLASSGGGRPPLGGLATRGFGRSNSRDVLLVARNAREQAKENEFLRRRVKELEEECGEHYEKVQSMRKHQAETKTREGSLRGEAAAHEAAAEQLALELERMRDIESQSATEAMALVQKTSRLQNELVDMARKASIAEELLAGVQQETDRALAIAERAMLQLRTTLEERGEWDGIPEEVSSLLDEATDEAAFLRDAVASAASEANVRRAEAMRVDSEHSKSELEKEYEAAMAELVELREENALMRADLSANHHFNQVAMNDVGSDSGSDTGSPGLSPKPAPTSRFGEEERNSPATAKKGQRSPKRPVWASPAPRSSFGKQLHESRSSHSLQKAGYGLTSPLSKKKTNKDEIKRSFGGITLA